MWSEYSVTVSGPECEVLLSHFSPDEAEQLSVTSDSFQVHADSDRVPFEKAVRLSAEHPSLTISIWFHDEPYSTDERWRIQAGEVRLIQLSYSDPLNDVDYVDEGIQYYKLPDWFCFPDMIQGLPDAPLVRGNVRRLESENTADICQPVNWQHEGF